MNGNTIQIEIKLKDDGTVKAFKDIGDQGERTGKRLKTSFSSAGSTIGSFNQMILGAGGLVAGITAAVYASKKIVDIADGWTLVEGRLKLVTTSSGQLARVQEDLFDLSQDTRQSYEATADLYGRLARSTDHLNKSDQDLLQVTEAINKSMIVSGATAQEANAAIIQLSQGLASGALRGDELRSVLEQTPRLAKAIAEGLGVSIGQLRELGAEGELTSEAVFGALLDQSAKIEEEFKQMPMTVGQSITKINNSLGKLISGSDKTLSATEALAGGISTVSGLIDDLASPVNKLLSIGGVVGLDGMDMGLVGMALIGGGPGAAALAASLLMVNDGVKTLTGKGILDNIDSLSGYDVIAEQHDLQREAYRETARIVQEMTDSILAESVSPSMTPEQLEAAAKAAEELRQINQELSDDITRMAMEEYEYKTWLLGQEIINLRQKVGASKEVLDTIIQYEAMKTLELERERVESDKKTLTERLGEYQKFYDDIGKEIESLAEKEKANILELNDLYRQQMDLRRSTEEMLADLGGKSRDAADQYRTTLAELDQQFKAAQLLGGQDQIAALEQYKQGIHSLAEEFKDGFDSTKGEKITGDAIRDIEAAYTIQKQVMADLTSASEKQIETNKIWGQELKEEAEWAADGIYELQDTIYDLDEQLLAMDKAVNLTAEDGISSVVRGIQQTIDQLHDKTITITTNYINSYDGSGGSGVEVLDSYATGTDYVPETGIYMLHQGEGVSTVAENQAARSAGSTAGFVIQGDLNITFPDTPALQTEQDTDIFVRDVLIPKLEALGK